MKTIYDVDYFIRKFESIPESKFCQNTFMCNGAKCFIGHTLTDEMIYKIWQAGLITDEKGEVKSLLDTKEYPLDFIETTALSTLLNPEDPSDGTSIGFKINNGKDKRYQQPTPKQRILACLYDIKNSQSEPKERTVYVTVDAKVRSLQKQKMVEN